VVEALADALADGPGAAVVASDRVRKHLAGVAPDARLAVCTDEGVYAPRARARVYEALLERAAPVVVSGRVAILDATWESRAERRRAVDCAASLGARSWVLEVRCPAAVALRRLEDRRAEGRDASDADPELYAASRDRYERASGAELPSWRVIETDQSEWRGAIAELAAELR